MQFEAEFRNRCAQRGLDEAAIAESLRNIEALEREVSYAGQGVDDVPVSLVERHIAALVARGEASEARITSLARYFMVAGADATAIRLLAYLLPIGVLPGMSDRLGLVAGEAARTAVMTNVTVPAEGSPPEAYSAATKAFVEALERELGSERARIVLTWNVHGIPPESFTPEKERLQALGSIDAWLEEYHARQVDILQRHADDGTLWYEQRITQAVVDFVRDHKEILGGVRDGDTIYLTKIPYDPDRYISSADLLMKRRLACHCPLAASSITESGAGVPSAWCACSAGYEKFLFDVAFGEDTDATVLSSVLAGDDLCRYAVRIPPSILHLAWP